MEYFFNILLARISLGIGILVSVIYILRIIKQSDMGKPAVFFAAAANTLLRRYHKLLGVVLLATGLIHGLLSSQSVWSLNFGTFCWIITLLLGVNWMVRSKLKKKGWIYYHRILTLLFVLTLVYHVIDVGGFSPHMFKEVRAQKVHSDAAAPVEAPAVPQEGGYKDGEYVGIANGYRPGLKVMVTVKGGKISKIDILSHNEKGERFYGPPMEIIPEEIIESQSTDVDAVSGATRTSEGIKKAVENALKQAEV